MIVFKKVKLVEKSPLALREKVELLLIYAQHKPATILKLKQKRNLQFASFYESDGEKFKERQITKLLGQLNLPYSIGPSESFCLDDSLEEKIEQVPVYVGMNEEWKERIVSAECVYDEAELGRCYGFPETAIQDYLGIRPPFLGNFHDSRPLGYFTWFIQSAEFKDEEIELSAIRWHDIVKRLSPKLYRQLTD